MPKILSKITITIHHKNQNEIKIVSLSDQLTPISYQLQHSNHQLIYLTSGEREILTKPTTKQLYTVAWEIRRILANLLIECKAWRPSRSRDSNRTKEILNKLFKVLMKLLLPCPKEKYLFQVQIKVIAIL